VKDEVGDSASVTAWWSMLFAGFEATHVGGGCQRLIRLTMLKGWEGVKIISLAWVR